MARPIEPGFNVGDKIKRWVVVGVTTMAHTSTKRGAYLCRCACGREKIMSKSRLKTQPPTQCQSCNMRELRRKQKRSSWNQTHLPEYHAWASMKSRCYYLRNPSFKNYGGRGITVCDKWRNDFGAFYVDMGARLTPQHSLERINNNGHYEPSNCIWATRSEQSSNRRNTHLLTARGETKTLSAWAKELGTAHTVVINRILKLGWSIEDACTKPIRRRTT